MANDTRATAGQFYPGGRRSANVDRREDAGEYYPRGKIIPRKPVTAAGDMFHSEFESLDPNESSLADVINRLKGTN